MLILIFAVTTLALAALAVGSRPLAAAALLVGLALSTGLFLFEIHSRQDGFRMPWLSTRADGPAAAALEADA